MVRGEQTRAPLTHCLQLMNCVAEAILERYRFWDYVVSVDLRSSEVRLTGLNSLQLRQYS
jgi:hypothetical protein